MTIELITGTPGAGKTTYGVARRLAVEVKRKFRAEGEDPSSEGVTRRLCVAGVRGLLLEHERLPHKLTGETISTSEVERFNAMDPEHEDKPRFQRLPGDPPRDDVPCLVQNWWLWCKPGDLIFVDEAQFLAPRGTLGKKPPYWIQALEIHRHYGVDFIFVTQHPQLIDTTIRNLVGVHRHVRSMMGSGLCVVYVWDHASNPERFKAAVKESFKRGPSDYALFHSSVAHLKPPSAGRRVLLIAPLLIAGAGFGLYQFKQKAFGGHAPASVASAPSAAASGQPGVLPGLPGAPGAVRPVFASASGPVSPSRPSGWVDVPELAGCWTQGDECTCMDRDGQDVHVGRDMCRVSASSFKGLVKWRHLSPISEEAKEALKGRLAPAAPGDPATSAGQAIAGRGG